MTSLDILTLCADIALGLLLLAMFIVFARLVRGPTLPDRILALDLLNTLAIGFVGVLAIRTGFFAYVDIAIAVGLLGFLSTLALTRYLLSRGKDGDERVSK